MKECQNKNNVLEGRKKEVVSKLNMAYLKDELESNLDKLSELIGKYL